MEWAEKVGWTEEKGLEFQALEEDKNLIIECKRG